MFRLLRRFSTVKNSPHQSSVKALYISKKIDVVSIYQKKNVGRLLEDDYLLVSFPYSNFLPESPPKSLPISPESTIISPPRQRKLAQKALGLKDEEKYQGRHCVFFSHGAVVFFNCDEVIQKECLELGRTFSKSILDEVQSEDYDVKVDHNISSDTWCVLEPNRLLLHSLNLENITLISTVLGQAVALRHFEYQIDNLLESFDKPEQEPLNALRESKDVVVDVILKLGLLDLASENSSAWNDNRYYRLWKGLREEFEIEKRWRVLSTKTSVLQDNLKFKVELKHAERSTGLEIAIVVLISVELAVSLLGFLGFGH